ncbi:hypothetical protein Tco_0629455 [Tanacetum coccineum]|uniref:Reverse transcriptase domain-containing protein n=1 Tax=Tanacetum coccineum TaxID=301880 RepID=A0ABQ4WTE4_9ASTR
MNTASSSGSLPSNTVANPRGDVKAITTRSGVSYDGPTILPTHSPLPKEVERKTEATKDKVQNTSLESTVYVQPLVVQDPILELVVAPKPSIPYPSRANKQKLREKDDNLASAHEKDDNLSSKFVEIYFGIYIQAHFADALIHF